MGVVRELIAAALLDKDWIEAPFYIFCGQLAIHFSSQDSSVRGY